MTDTRDILFAIDGVLAQCAVAQQLYESQEVSTLPIDAIYAATMTLRTLVEVAPPPGTERGCQHPPEAVQHRVLGGGGFVNLCTACNDIIDQG